MIIAWLFETVCGFVAWVIGLFPSWDTPSWWVNVTTWLDGLEAIHHFGNVIPLQAIATAAVALAAATVTVTIISTSRVAYSMVTGGGGAK